MYQHLAAHSVCTVGIYVRRVVQHVGCEATTNASCTAFEALAVPVTLMLLPVHTHMRGGPCNKGRCTIRYNNKTSLPSKLFTHIPPGAVQRRFGAPIPLLPFSW